MYKIYLIMKQWKEETIPIKKIHTLSLIVGNHVFVYSAILFSNSDSYLAYMCLWIHGYVKEANYQEIGKLLLSLD